MAPRGHGAPLRGTLRVSEEGLGGVSPTSGILFLRTISEINAPNLNDNYL